MRKEILAWIQNHPMTSWISIITVIIFLFCVFALDTTYFDDLFVSPKGKELNPANADEVDAILLFFTGVATVAIAVGAYIQIKHLNEGNTAEFLLRIDERWTSPEILKARTIIHGIGLEIAHQKPQNLEENIGQEIIQLSTDTNRKEEFMYLLNFLDFMETIGFLFYIKKRVASADLDELCGDSIRFYFKVFKPYIDFKEKKGEYNYTSFKKLYEELTLSQST